jgi:hypothetical protein
MSRSATISRGSPRACDVTKVLKLMVRVYPVAGIEWFTPTGGPRKELRNLRVLALLPRKNPASMAGVGHGRDSGNTWHQATVRNFITRGADLSIRYSVHTRPPLAALLRPSNRHLQRIHAL